MKDLTYELPEGGNGPPVRYTVHDDGQEYHYVPEPLLTEAKAEVERLRTEVERLRAELKETIRDRNAFGSAAQTLARKLEGRSP